EVADQSAAQVASHEHDLASAQDDAPRTAAPGGDFLSCCGAGANGVQQCFHFAQLEARCDHAPVATVAIDVAFRQSAEQSTPSDALGLVDQHHGDFIDDRIAKLALRAVE